MEIVVLFPELHVIIVFGLINLWRDQAILKLCMLSKVCFRADLRLLKMTAFEYDESSGIRCFQEVVSAWLNGARAGMSCTLTCEQGKIKPSNLERLVLPLAFSAYR
jgi:hypothetical protein